MLRGALEVLLVAEPQQRDGEGAGSLGRRKGSQGLDDRRIAIGPRRATALAQPDSDELDLTGRERQRATAGQRDVILVHDDLPSNSLCWFESQREKVCIDGSWVQLC